MVQKSERTVQREAALDATECVPRRFACLRDSLVCYAGQADCRCKPASRGPVVLQGMEALPLLPWIKEVLKISCGLKDPCAHTFTHIGAPPSYRVMSSQSQ